MRPFLPIAAAVLLTAGAVSIPAIAAQTSPAHHTWKKANIDTSAMSASMSAQNPNAFQPSTGSNADQQPGAIAPAADTTGGAMSSDTGMTSDSTATAPQPNDTSMQSNAGNTDATATTHAKKKAMKHGKHTSDTGASSSSSMSQDMNAPGAVDSSSNMQNGNMQNGMSSSTTGSDTTPAMQPDASKGMTTPPADTSSTPK